MSVLEIKNIEKSFGSNQVLKDISIQVEDGEIISVIGPSGSGKSTLLRCAAMLETMDRGAVLYAEKKAVWNEGDGRVQYAGKEEMKEIQSMPVGQYEAAKLLGYTKSQTFFRIIFPQVVKRILPSITNEVITLVKDTSLAFTISVMEMFTVAKALASSQVSMVPFVAAGLFYYIFNLLVASFMEYAEKKMNYYQ